MHVSGIHSNPTLFFSPVMEILYSESMVQVEPAIPIRRGRGRPPILNKKPLVQAVQVEAATRLGRGRPPCLHKKNLVTLEPGVPQKKDLVPLKPGTRRGRGRPRKQRSDEVSKPVIDVLANRVFKKPRTKAKFLGESSYANSNLPSTSSYARRQPLDDVKIPGSVPSFDTSKSCVDMEASPSMPSNCVCYQPFSEIEIPGSIPNFDTWEFDGHHLSNFFEDIPYVSSARGWCKFCKQ